MFGRGHHCGHGRLPDCEMLEKYLTLVIKGCRDIALFDLLHDALMAAAGGLSEVVSKCGSIKLLGLRLHWQQSGYAKPQAGIPSEFNDVTCTNC